MQSQRTVSAPSPWTSVATSVPASASDLLVRQLEQKNVEIAIAKKLLQQQKERETLLLRQLATASKRSPNPASASPPLNCLPAHNRPQRSANLQRLMMRIPSTCPARHQPLLPTLPPTMRCPICPRPPKRSWPLPNPNHTRRFTPSYAHTR